MLSCRRGGVRTIRGSRSPARRRGIGTSRGGTDEPLGPITMGVGPTGGPPRWLRTRPSAARSAAAAPSEASRTGGGKSARKPGRAHGSTRRPGACPDARWSIRACSAARNSSGWPVASSCTRSIAVRTVCRSSRAASSSWRQRAHPAACSAIQRVVSGALRPVT